MGPNMKFIALTMTFFFCFSSFANESKFNTSEELQNLSFIEDPLQKDVNDLGSIQSMSKSTLIFNPQANVANNSLVPIYFHIKSDPKVICQKYNFSNYVKGSVLPAEADFNHEHTIVTAYKYKNKQLHFTLPAHTNRVGNDHLNVVNEISCY